ncbi:MAG TPA: hypothetical protein VMW48_13555, partial [Vicinamibacterales bacterium]|nr:hypothetical protein [Vicinamibacterales bacterium]
MLNPITVLLGGLAAVVVAFIYAWWRSAAAGHPHARPTLMQLAIGTVGLFFDTLGIGNYAPTTAAFRFLKIVKDEWIPGTLNVGSSVPVAVEAFAFVTAIAVDPLTLGLMVPVGALGGYLGAGIVSRLPRRRVQLGMALALVVGAAFMTVTNLQWIPGGGDAIGFSGATLVVAILMNFAFCALNALGIGSYAPSLIVFSLLGMSPRSAFPIMMGSAAYGLPLAGIKFARTGRYDGKAALGLALGGIPGVLVAAYVVKSLPLEAIRWLV